MTISFVLNGRSVELEAANPHGSFLDWLRSAGLTGAKEGCAEGECGACGVAMLRSDAAGRTCFEAVNSCLLPLAAAQGRSFVSVEGVAQANRSLHPVQLALVDHGASQCGYCTPGFVMSLFCEYYRPDRTSYDPEAISGNLCRCTGYRPIVDAAKSLGAPEASDPRSSELERTPAALAPHEHQAHGRLFLRPTTLAGVLEALQRHPNATLISGGTDLMVLANQRAQRWEALLSLDAVEELTRFHLSAEELLLGAALPLSHLEQRHAELSEFRMLQQVLPRFSSRLIRNRATLGGSLGTASPIGDLAPVLLALNAELTLLGAGTWRRLPLREFFVGYRRTGMQPGELIASVHVPRAQPALQCFYKVSKRVADDISTIAAAFALALDDSRRVTELRIGLGGVAATPLRAVAAEQVALGRVWNVETLELVAEELARSGTPMSDQRGSAAYRRAMLANLARKFFAELNEPENAE